MNVESRPELTGTQSSRSSISYKRARRSSRKPVLVTQETVPTDTPVAENAPLIVEESANSGARDSAVSSEKNTRQRGPKFLKNVEQDEQAESQPKADPIAARFARALRGKPASPSSNNKEEKTATPKKTPVVTTTPPRSGFKTRYIFGMIAYLLIADVAGVWIQNWMVANHLDATVFTWGPIIGNRSTLIFLGLLIVILLAFARFDLIPRSFAGARNSSSSTKTSTTRERSTTSTPKGSQPSMRQGVQGEDDALYREYRANQRYYQKRDRKR